MLVQEREILLLALIGGRVAAKDCDYCVPKSAYLQWLPFFALLLIAGVQGFVSLPVALPGDELSTYASHHNPIRILLAYGIGVLLFPSAPHAFAGTQGTRGKNWIAFSTGMQIASSWVRAAAIFDRAVSVGLLDLDFVLRVSGPFHSMHIGGQHIDAY